MVEQEVIIPSHDQNERMRIFLLFLSCLKTLFKLEIFKVQYLQNDIIYGTQMRNKNFLLTNMVRSGFFSKLNITGPALIHPDERGSRPCKGRGLKNRLTV